MLQFILTKEFFPGFKLPKNPTDLDRNIQQIIDADTRPVRISEEKSVAIIFHYMKDKTPEQLWLIGHNIVNKPGSHMLWMLTSESIHSLCRKLVGYVAEEDERNYFQLEEDKVTVHIGRVGFSPHWLTYSVFFNINLFEFTISGDYQIEVELTEQLKAAIPIIEKYHENVSIKLVDEEPKVSLSGEGVLNRPLITANPALETVLLPDFKYALLPESNDLLEPARIVLRENIDNQDFDLADLAKLLCVSPRTVQRKLQTAGTTFMKLKNEERVNFITKRLSQGNAKETLTMMAGLNDLDTIQKMISKR